HGLQAAIDLARDADALAIDGELGGERALRPAEQGCQHLTRLIAVVVDRLLAHDDEARLFLFDDAFEDFCHSERLHDTVDLHQDAAVGTHRERGADRLGRLLRADRDRDDLSRRPLFLQPDRLLDGDLIEGVHRHLDVGEFAARAIRLDANLDVEIDHPLDGHQYFHTWKLPPRAARKLWSTLRPVNAIPSGVSRVVRRPGRAARRLAACNRTGGVPGGAAAPPTPPRPASPRYAPT